jgi:hypothetical protein
MIIYELVKAALASLSPAVPFALAPFKGTGALPDQYIAYQLIGSPPEQSADNAETERSYLVQVTIWSRAGLAVLPNVDAAMSAAGFQKGNQRQLPQDSKTGHYGLATDYVYLG